MSRKIFTYHEARQLVPEVGRLTSETTERVGQFTLLQARYAEGSPQYRKLRDWMTMALQRWAEGIQALGARPKVMWIVDFDAGEGYLYCWTLGESDLTHFHRVEEGFAGRKPLRGRGLKALPLTTH